jgi:hypothetical protein
MNKMNYLNIPDQVMTTTAGASGNGGYLSIPTELHQKQAIVYANAENIK